MLEMDAFIEDAWAQHSLGNAPRCQVVEKRISVRHLHFLIKVLELHAIIPIDFDLKVHSNIGPITEQG
jgi:hypothetical protein